MERCLEVACKFAASFLKNKEKEPSKDDNKDETESQKEEEEATELPPFMGKLLGWLLDHHEVEGSQARLRICLMVNKLLKLMGEDASIDDDLYEKIYDNMLQRMKDKVADIRSQAVTALERLQDPSDKECPIVKAFVFHLAYDSSAIVRRTIIKVIGASRITLNHVLRRTKDADDAVRKAAFKFIAEKVHIKSLKISQREEVLQRGLNDRSESVRAVVERELISSWLKHCNDNIVELLYALDIRNSDEKPALDMLKVFFKGLPYQEICESFKYLDENKLIPYEKLTEETAIYWRSVVIFLFNEGGSAHVSSSIFCTDSDF